MWARSKAYGNSMKWHLADPNSIEEYEEEVGWGAHKRLEKRLRVTLTCAGSEYNQWVLNHCVVRESLKLSQANICAYDKKARMKELGIMDMHI